MNLSVVNKEPPRDYPLCVSSTCPLRSSCLHARVAEMQLHRERISLQVNPHHPDYKEGQECTLYRSASPECYARGFRKALDTLSKKNYTACVQYLIATTSKSYFYRIRAGEVPLSPLEQKELYAVLQAYGYAGSDPFDCYEYRFSWQ